MALIEFVQNHEDLSTDRGFQFKFFCDRCHNGFLTSFQSSLVGTAGSLLRAAGDLFGGIISSAGNSAYEVQRMIGGPAHDAALKAAVEEARPSFHQCARCAKWVCGNPCWNPQASLCADCAPNFQVEFAASHAQAKVDAARQQLNERAQATDYASGAPMGAGVVAQALPAAPAPWGSLPAQPQPPPALAGLGAAPPFAPAGGFAQPPGAAQPGYAPPPAAAHAPPTPNAQAPGAPRGAVACASCGTTSTSKFCPDCGTAMPAPRPTCPACGHQPAAPTRFCGECGAKMG